VVDGVHPRAAADADLAKFPRSVVADDAVDILPLAVADGRFGLLDRVVSVAHVCTCINASFHGRNEDPDTDREPNPDL
jgi:hypothetical protein